MNCIFFKLHGTHCGCVRGCPCSVSLRSWRSCEKAESSMRRIQFLARWGKQKYLEWRGWGRGGESPLAQKLRV